MKRIVLLLQLVILTVCTPAQTIERPKLIVGIVVDQMRWDYLYRYFDRYAANGGFKRM
ncbi:MAG: alkaline phosphatase family protein, partial [Flavisolibacter sp.]|nr:alkaline phosphatase family protein [Flavisolibacter sp.]